MLNEQGWTLAQFPLTAAALGDLVKLVVGGEIEITRAKEVFNDMVANKRSAADSMQALGIAKVDLVRAGSDLQGDRRRQSQDRRRRERRQAASRRRPRRPGQEAEPQRQPQRRAADLPGADREDVGCRVLAGA